MLPESPAKQIQVVQVYAIDSFRTHEDHCNDDQTVFTSTRLEKPVASTTFHWQIRYEGGEEGAATGASYQAETPEQLAVNLAGNLKGNFADRARGRRSVSFTIPKEAAAMRTEMSGPRELTVPEKEAFARALSNEQERLGTAVSVEDGGGRRY